MEVTLWLFALTVLKGAAQLQAILKTANSYCNQTTVITQMAHGKQGKYSRIPLPPLWAFMLGDGHMHNRCKE
jgi:hypothetical protein